MSVLQNEYNRLKSKYPSAVIWFSLNGYVECFSECAVKTSDVLGTVLTNRPDNNLIISGFDESYLETNLKKMTKSGYTIVLAGSSYLNSKKGCEYGSLI